MLLEQIRAVLFVPIARPGQLAGMQHFANVVSCCTEQNCILVGLQIGPATLKGIQNLGSGIMNEGKVNHQTRRRIERLQ